MSASSLEDEDFDPSFTPFSPTLLDQDRGTRARREFYAAVWGELRDKGYAGLNVSGVVNRAGASRGRFYHHFKNLEEALLKAHRHHSDLSFRRAQEAAENGLPVEEALVTELLETLPTSPGRYLADIELMLVSMRNERIHKLFMDDFELRLQQASDLVQLGVERGELTDERSARSVAEQLFTGAYGIYLLYFARRNSGELVAQLQSHLRSVFASVRAPIK